MNNGKYIKGRGAQKNVNNKFAEHNHELRDDFLNYCNLEGDAALETKTVFIDTFPKTIVNKVQSPDIGMGYSLNPYQGCEHGCIYCYARNSHEFWGYDAGLDFESRILVKRNAIQLLEKKLLSKSWQAVPIVLSGNTDCYQPIEQKLKLTRGLLEVFFKYRHPVGIITKNAAILRDLDILKHLAKDNLIQVNISITSLSEDTRRLLEPRTASIKKRFRAVKELSEAGIPVRVMVAPIIPGINTHEILPLIAEAAAHGAQGIGHTVVRLNGAIGTIFTDWIQKTMPNKANKVLNQIAACHDGNLNDSQYGRRMHGEGVYADQIAQQIALGKKKYFKNTKVAPLNTQLHAQYKSGQYSLF